MVSATRLDTRIHAPPRSRVGAVLIMVGAVVAFALTGSRYFTPLSGITGAGGALLTLGAELLLLLMGLALLRMHGLRARRTVLILAWLVVILTLISALFLHGWISAGFLGLAAIGVVVQTFSEPRGA